MSIFQNIDVVETILEFATTQVLDSHACISRVFRSARNNAAKFDQTRTGTIIFKTNVEDVPLETWQRWDQQVFVGNRTRLVAILSTLPGVRHYRYVLPFALNNVREVTLMRDPSIEVREELSDRDQGGNSAVAFFKTITPNLTILDIGPLAKTTRDIGSLNFQFNLLNDLRARVFSCLTPDEQQNGYSLAQPAFDSLEENAYLARLQELHLEPFRVYLRDAAPPIDAYCKEFGELEEEKWFRQCFDDHQKDWVLLQEYPNLERVTLKRAEYLKKNDFLPFFDYWKALPEEVLIKFVRHTPSLRWFRSDLAPETVVMLQQERPEVEFCN